MSFTSTIPGAKITVPDILQRKSQAAGSPTNKKIACLTAYDYPTARLLDEAGVDVILVGDSLGMVVLGYDSTLPVTIDEMLHHTRGVVPIAPWWLPICRMAATTRTWLNPCATPCASLKMPAPKRSK
jgi:ketopantoate hydroxymethyltransferase